MRSSCPPSPSPWQLHSEMPQLFHLPKFTPSKRISHFPDFLEISMTPTCHADPHPGFYSTTRTLRAPAVDQTARILTGQKHSHIWNAPCRFPYLKCSLLWLHLNIQTKHTINRSTLGGDHKDPPDVSEVCSLIRTELQQPSYKDTSQKIPGG